MPVPHAIDTSTPRWSIWTLVSAICGIVSVVGVGGAIFSITAVGVLCVAAGPALVCGLVGLVNISESSGRLKGRGFAVAGVILGTVGIIVLTHIVTTQLLSALPTPAQLFPSDD
jgi:hypothetical protein